MKSRVLPLVATLGIAMASGAAQALPFFPSSGFQAGTLFEDQNLDWHVDNDSDGLISVGDRLISVLEFGEARDILPPISPAVTLNQAADELVAVADITVTSISPTGRATFGQSGLTPMVRAFNLGSSINLDLGTYVNCSSQAACIAAVTDGALFAEFSIADADDEWFFQATSPIAFSPAAVAASAQTSLVGVANFALSQVGGPALLAPLQIDCLLFACAGDGRTTLVGSANLLGGANVPLTVGAFATSDTDVSVIPVPEPASLALLGAGLLGLGALRRSRRSRRA